MEYLTNDHPPWAEYCTLMAGRIIVLDKHPGVYPVGIGETWCP